VVQRNFLSDDLQFDRLGGTERNDVELGVHDTRFEVHVGSGASGQDGVHLGHISVSVDGSALEGHSVRFEGGLRDVGERGVLALDLNVGEVRGKRSNFEGTLVVGALSVQSRNIGVGQSGVQEAKGLFVLHRLRHDRQSLSGLEGHFGKVGQRGLLALVGQLGGLDGREGLGFEVSVEQGAVGLQVGPSVSGKPGLDVQK